MQSSKEQNGEKVFSSEQHKEMQENNRMGNIRELLKKIGEIRELFMQGWTHKRQKWQDPNRNRRGEEEVARIHKRTMQKDLNDSDNHEGVITHLKPDILESEVKWALGSITIKKASGGDGIPVELFQILKDDALKALYPLCQQIWKTQPWPQDWKRSVFTPIPKKDNAKQCSNCCTTVLISHASKVSLKILQARLQQYVNCEPPDVQTGFRKGRGTRDQIANIRWIMEKARIPEKHIFLLD